MRDIILSLASFLLLVMSVWLFNIAKTKRKKVEFTYDESEKRWVVFKTNYWTILTSYIRKNTKTVLFASILASVLIVLVIYYIYGESALGTTFAIVLAIWGSVFGSLLLGTQGTTGEEISSGTEVFYKIFKETVENIKEIFSKDKDENIVYSGFIELPSKIYVDESEKIAIYLEGKAQSKQPQKESMEITSIEDVKLVDINLKREQNKSEFLKAELQGSSLKIGGDTKQQVSLVNNIIKFHWSISSDKSTRHKFSLIFSKISDGSIKYLGELDHTVKVVNLWGLSSRNLSLLAYLVGLIGLIYYISKIVEALGYLEKK